MICYVASSAWTPEHSELIKDEGWDMFESSNGQMQIESDNDQDVFLTDYAAMDFVVEKALSGSRIHLFALMLDGRKKNQVVYLPENECE